VEALEGLGEDELLGARLLAKACDAPLHHIARKRPAWSRASSSSG